MADGAGTASTAAVEVAADFGPNPEGLVTRWVAWLKLTDKENEKFEKRGKSIVKRYRDDRDTTQDSQVRFNVLWANVNLQEPAIYLRPPRAQVERRYRDADPIGRLAAQILERAVGYEMERQGVHETIKLCVQDRLLPGRGVARVLYRPTFDASKKVVIDEEALVDYVFWDDFRCSPARVWAEVDACAYRVYMTRDELETSFPDVGSRVPLNVKSQHKDILGASADIFSKAEVWEIWDRASKKTLWINKDFGERPLKMGSPPLNLDAFFPSPRPLLSTHTNDSIVPVADFYEYQGQAEELDMLTQRIGILLKALRMKGFYAGDEKSILAQLFSENSGENEMVPVHDWAAFMDKGGVEKMIAWFPIEQLANVLTGLVAARKEIKQDLYEITGLSDILRGSTEASETATAQNIKSRFGTLRLQTSQQEAANFARDILRLMAEVIAEQFSPELLTKMTGLPELPARPQIQQPQPPGPNAMQDPQQMQVYQQQVMQFQQVMGKWQADTQKAQADYAAAIQLLKNDKLRGFRLDVETDSTIAPDEEAEKQGRVEFLTALGVFFEKVAPLVQTGLVPADVAKEMLLFLARGFKAGRELEMALEKLDQIAPQQQGPDLVEAAKAKAEEARVQLEGQRLQMDGQKAMAEHTLNEQKAVAEHQLNTQKATDDHAFRMAQLAQGDKKLELERDKVKNDELARAGELLLSHGKNETDKATAESSAKQAEQAHKLKADEAAGVPSDQPEWLTKAMDAIGESAQHVEKMGAVIEQMQQDAAAPAEVVRDPKTGKVIGVKKGATQRAVTRDENGRVVALN